ncbi:helix-turn-helix transcriptional regulator [Shinella fusca]|uniref:helix-turn-helix transcriptional regulator n=1 Tax=Shinella fusca TaxID=544480 RepID=UPI0031B62014
MNSDHLTLEQCRGARAMLGWSQAQLAEAANVSRQTIADFERGAHTPIGNNLASIIAAFQKAGIDFIPENGGGVGVRFRDPG